MAHYLWCKTRPWDPATLPKPCPHLTLRAGVRGWNIARAPREHHVTTMTLANTALLITASWDWVLLCSQWSNLPWLKETKIKWSYYQDTSLPCKPLLFCCHQCSYERGQYFTRGHPLRSRAAGGRSVGRSWGRLSEPLTTLLFRAVECRPFEDPLRNFPFVETRIRSGEIEREGTMQTAWYQTNGAACHMKVPLEIPKSKQGKPWFMNTGIDYTHYFSHRI